MTTPNPAPPWLLATERDLVMAAAKLLLRMMRTAHRRLAPGCDDTPGAS
jgi:hypothetical protein